MLPHPYRLKNSKDFDRAYKKGRHVKGAFGKIVVLDRNDEDPPRIGIVISAKRGKAHRRNRAKRQIREAFRTHLPDIRLGTDISYVVWDAEFTFDTIQKEIAWLLKKAGILNTAS